MVPSDVHIVFICDPVFTLFKENWTTKLEPLVTNEHIHVLLIYICFRGIKRLTHITSTENSIVVIDVYTVQSIISQLIVPKFSYTEYAWRPCNRLLSTTN